MKEKLDGYDANKLEKHSSLDIFYLGARNEDEVAEQQSVRYGSGVGCGEVACCAAEFQGAVLVLIVVIF